MSYRLVENWRDIVESVRNERVQSPSTSVSWRNGNKHGLEEGSVSRDILSFISRRPNQTTNRDEIVAGLPTAFQVEGKIPREFVVEFLRELGKMGILEKLEITFA